jgi:hypothetical protein
MYAIVSRIRRLYYAASAPARQAPAPPHNERLTLRSRFAWAVMLAAPSVAMAVVAVALFGPGAARPVQAARLWGGPTLGLSSLSWRVSLVRRFREVDSTIGGTAVVVRAETSSRSAASDRCTTVDDGFCDVELTLPEPASGALSVSVSRDDGEPAAQAAVRTSELASGRVSLDASGWRPQRIHHPEIAGSRRGQLLVRAFALRGVLVAPFWETIALTVADSSGQPRANARIELKIEGGESALVAGSLARKPQTPTADDVRGSETASVVTDARGRAELYVIARAHEVQLTAEATAGTASGAFSGPLPIVPGALWLDPSSRAGGEVRVVAPGARPRAYATLATRSARTWAAVVPLVVDAQGFASGAVPWPARSISADEPAWLTLASDPLGRGSGTVGWPVGFAREEQGVPEQAFADELLLDGMPDAERREAARRRQAGWLVLAALGGAAGLEAILVARSAQTKAEKTKRGWLGVAGAVATIVLAFAAIAMVALWKAMG